MNKGKVKTVIVLVITYILLKCQKQVRKLKGKI